MESLGATEGAPAAGTAEAIVDITTTGTTLAANGLKTLHGGTILKSQAQLVASSAAQWSECARAIAGILLSRLSARAHAQASLVLRARIERNSAAVLARLGGELGATILSGPGPQGECAILCPRAALMSAITLLRQEGCTSSVTVEEAHYVFEQNDPLRDSFNAFITQ